MIKNTQEKYNIPGNTRIGQVRLTVADLKEVTAFYREVFGFVILRSTDQETVLGTPAKIPLLLLAESPGAPKRPPGTTGLFHMAIVLPTRADLARMLLRMQEQNVPPRGAADHLVSEALYLSDPEGNGIEIYRDRPKSEWEYSGNDIKMSTLPLKVQELMDTLDNPHPLERIPDDTRMGHIHLNVADIEETDHFYSDILGFDVMARFGSEATFMAAGGYHHHIGANVWNGRGASPPSDGARGLRWFELVLPDESALNKIMERLDQNDIAFSWEDSGILVRDPSGNWVRIIS